jgi:carboxymethylenebutenolidase
MCHAYDADPPIPRLAGAAVDSSHVTLTSQDGTRFAAFLVRSATPRGPGVVVLPDVRGLFRFYEELALRFAEEGITTIGIDYFGRTAGVGARDATFPFMEHVMQTRAESIRADVAAAVAYVRSPEGAPAAQYSR